MEWIAQSNQVSTTKILSRYFLAHEACQIWLTKLWEGGIIVLSPPDALIPPEAKIILSALLLFPINFWIQYSGKEFLKHQMKADEPDIFTDEIASHETDPIALTLDNVNRHTGNWTWTRLA